MAKKTTLYGAEAAPFAYGIEAGGFYDPTQAAGRAWAAGGAAGRQQVELGASRAAQAMQAQAAAQGANPLAARSAQWSGASLREQALQQYEAEQAQQRAAMELWAAQTGQQLAGSQAEIAQRLEQLRKAQEAYEAQQGLQIGGMALGGLSSGIGAAVASDARVKQAVTEEAFQAGMQTGLGAASSLAAAPVRWPTPEELEPLPPAAERLARKTPAELQAMMGPPGPATPAVARPALAPLVRRPSLAARELAALAELEQLSPALPTLPVERVFTATPQAYAPVRLGLEPTPLALPPYEPMGAALPPGAMPSDERTKRQAGSTLPAWLDLEAGTPFIPAPTIESITGTAPSGAGPQEVRLMTPAELEQLQDLARPGQGYWELPPHYTTPAAQRQPRSSDERAAQLAAQLPLTPAARSRAMEAMTRRPADEEAERLGRQLDRLAREATPRRWVYDVQAAGAAGFPMRAGGMQQRPRTSPTAQDLERSEVGRQLVQSGPGGLKVVDTQQAALTNLALSNRLDERLRRIEDLLGGP